MSKPDQINGVAVPYHASTPVLIAQLKADPPACWVAYVALAYRTEESEVNALVDNAMSSDWCHRRAAAESLGHHGESDVIAPTLLKMLDDESQYVIRTACSALARLGRTEAHERILRLLGSIEPLTRSECLRALRVLWRETDFEPIFSIFERDPFEDVKREAAWTLREHAGNLNWRRLFDVWKTGNLSRYRIWACELADAFGSLAVLDNLKRLAGDEDGHVRKAAKSSLEKVG